GMQVYTAPLHCIDLISNTHKTTSAFQFFACMVTILCVFWTSLLFHLEDSISSVSLADGTMLARMM
uniref:Uncharacterized protein n=1 Tax=Aegilops tauschii subsp. strangulata TaxID=200361 RepID=A0A453RQG2_AEGTS